MKSKHLSITHFLTALLMMTASAAVSAQTSNDFGTWTSLQVNKVWKSPEGGVSPYAMTRAEHRSFEKASATECFFLMAGGGLAVNKYFKADLSYEFWKIPANGWTTAHKGVLCLTGSITNGGLGFFLREKYELAYSPDTRSSSHTLRSRLRAQYDISAIRLTPYIMYEFFNSLTGAGWIRSLHYAGVEYRFGKHSSIDVFYMYHLYASTGGTAGEHVAGLGYNLNF